MMSGDKASGRSGDGAVIAEIERGLTPLDPDCPGWCDRKAGWLVIGADYGIGLGANIRRKWAIRAPWQNQSML